MQLELDSAADLGPYAAARAVVGACDFACPLPDDPTDAQLERAAIDCGLYCSPRARQRPAAKRSTRWEPLVSFPSARMQNCSCT